MASLYLFNSTTREINSTNIALGHLLWKIIGKKLEEKEALLNYMYES